MKYCKFCQKEFEDKTSNQNRICCSKVCVTKLWYLKKTGKTTEAVRPKNTIESYRQIVLDLGLIFLRIERNGKQPKLVVKCKEEHEWVSSITNLKQTKGGCRKCYGFSRRSSLKEAKDAALGKNFTLNEVDYKAGNQKTTFTCNACGYAWFVSLSNFKRYSCPGCKPGVESKVRSIFESLTNRKFPSVRPPWLKNPNSKSNGLMQLDGYCEELKLAFEYDGEFHYVPFWGTNTTSGLDATKIRDNVKDSLCSGMGITLIRIPYTEKKNLEWFIRNKLTKMGYINAEV